MKYGNYFKTKRERRGDRFKRDDENRNIVVDLKETVTRRMVVLGGIIIFLMLLLIVKLYDIQIINQRSYQTKLTRYVSRFRRITTPRGEIVDRNNNLLVTNRQVIEIVYYPASDATVKKKWELAGSFAKTFGMNGNSLTVRDLKDLFLFLYPDQAKAKISETEWAQYYDKQISDNDIYHLKLDRIDQRDLDGLSSAERDAWSVYTLMNTATISQFAVIKDDVPFEEVSYFLEHNEDFRGFDITIDWEREYTYGSTLRNVLGSITTTKSGLPAENLNYYLAQDYSRNEKVGKSGIEMQYEELLSGERALYDVAYSSDGLAVLKEVQGGGKGYDLRLALDVNLQSRVEEIIIDAFEDEKNNPYRKYWNTAYVVVMDPNTGDVLSLAGIKKTENGYFSDPVSTYTESLVVGSIVKGATVYMGLDSKVVKQGEKILDTPIKIKDTPLKSSHQNLGWVNDLQALSLSSNVYMFNVAIRLGGAIYEYDKPLNLNLKAFDTMRNYFSQFGLGVMTQIDVPNEGVGYQGYSTLGGHLLDYAIGQFATYTPIQMAQYVSAIANGGYLVKPRILLEAYYPQTETIAYQNNVTILSSLDNQSALERVQTGLRLCVTDGLCKWSLNNLPVEVAAKTGTAENTVPQTGTPSPNSTLIAYAPYDKPQVAIACAAVNAWNNKSQINVCQKIAGQIFESYFQQP